MTTMTKAQTLNLTRHSSYVLQEVDCDTEVARQPVLVRVIKTEMASQEFGVRVELRETHEVSERYPHIRSKTSKSTKENDEPKGGKGGKDTQDGKGKDHQPSQPSLQTTLQPKSRSGHCLQPRQRRPQGRGRAAMAAFPDPSGCAALCKITGDNRGSFPGKDY